HASKPMHAHVATPINGARRPGTRMSDVHCPGAVAERFYLNVRLVQKREMQIRERNLLARTGTDVAAALEATHAAAREQYRKRVVVVDVAIAHATAPHQNGVVEQRVFTVRRLPHLLQQIAEESDVVAIDLRQLLDV